MGCNHDCSNCSQSCGGEQDLHEPLNQYSSVKHVIGVVSGKGGVGKSMVTSQLAVTMNRRGLKTAILDADITGPSIPKAFGIHERAKGSDLGILPAVTETGIELMSINLLLKEETDPVVWRSPMIVGTLKQFWTDVVWNDVDYMFVDMPPGTGDIPLTVFQSLPLDGIIVVASPQELVSMIVEKAVKMAEMMKVPLLGLVENMSYFVCPDCARACSQSSRSIPTSLQRLTRVRLRRSRATTSAKLRITCKPFDEITERPEKFRVFLFFILFIIFLRIF